MAIIIDQAEIYEDMVQFLKDIIQERLVIMYLWMKRTLPALTLRT